MRALFNITTKLIVLFSNKPLISNSPIIYSCLEELSSTEFLNLLFLTMNISKGIYWSNSPICQSNMGRIQSWKTWKSAIWSFARNSRVRKIKLQNGMRYQKRIFVSNATPQKGLFRIIKKISAFVLLTTLFGKKSAIRSLKILFSMKNKQLMYASKDTHGFILLKTTKYIVECLLKIVIGILRSSASSVT